MAKSLQLAIQAMDIVTQRLPPQTLARTSYCAMMVKLQNGTRAVLISEAGATAGGIRGPLLAELEISLQAPVIGCAAPIVGQGTWHMNDAEQQALRTHAQADGALAGSTIKAVVANRRICDSCAHTLRTMHMTVNGARAWAP